MKLLLLKLILAPALIAVASLAGRRWGHGIGGFVIGFPIVACPILLVFALEQGEAFAAHAATSTLSGEFCLAAYCVTYSWAARRLPWAPSLLLGWSAFALAAALMKPLALGWVGGGLLAFFSLNLAPLVMPRLPEPSTLQAPPGWDLPARMAAAAALVLALTGLAAWLGPGLSGILTTFPVASTVVVAFTHAHQGPGAVDRVFKGFLRGLNGYVTFLLVLALALERLGIGWAFGLGLSGAALVQAAFLFWTSKKP